MSAHPHRRAAAHTYPALRLSTSEAGTLGSRASTASKKMGVSKGLRKAEAVHVAYRCRSEDVY